MARRLLHITALCRIDLDPAIAALATQDVLAAANPLRGIRRAATQFMLDCDLRCAVPLVLATLDRALVLNAVHLAGLQTVTIASGLRQRWTQLLKTVDFDAKILTINQAFEPEHQDGRRDGVLLLDWPESGHSDWKLIGLAKEFPRTIIISEAIQHPLLLNPAHAAGDVSWWPMGHCLCPEMPDARLFIHDVFDRYVTGSPVWSARHCLEMAMFYHVFLPHFADLPGYAAG